LGRVFVGDLTRGLGGLARGFLEFGAASEPTLRSLSSGISGLLGQGLPGMFDGLERGVEGSSKFFDGLFGMINETFPALGRFSGEVARTFGPALGEQLTLTGHVVSRVLDVMGYAARALKPVFNDITFGLKAIWLIAQPFAAAFKDAGAAIVGALMPAGTSIENVRGPLQRLHSTVQENKLGLMEYARIGGTFMLMLAEGVIRYLPDAIGGFRLLAMGALSSFDVIISGLAMTIGKIPGFGDKFREANTEFDKFRDGFINGLETAKGKTQDFANATLPRLSQNKLQMNISAWESQINVAKGQLASVPPEKRSQLTAHIADLERKAAQARSELASIRSRDVTVTLTYITRGSMNNTTMRMEGLTRADGGIVRGPGTSTSDSIPAMLSDGEVRRPGLGRPADRGPRPGLTQPGQGLTNLASAVGPGLQSQPAVRSPGVTVVNNNITVDGAMDPVAVAQQLERLLLKLQRNYGLTVGVLAR
jgi:hypothetical protein